MLQCDVELFSSLEDFTSDVRTITRSVPQALCLLLVNKVLMTEKEKNFLTPIWRFQNRT
jgi:hypothetical protein